MSRYEKDPDAKLDYALDWSAWLPEGDSITVAQWTVPDGLDQSDDTIDGTKTTVWLSGGQLGERHVVTCRVTTAQGRIDDRSISLHITDR